ncbi:MAG: cysteine desulfurase [Bacilli bacterium]|jgi:cysteine desulfurase|nr:cysteine desulfurase [Bacilli bacterium]MCH4202095.1 cysteine desulfurase [Bacilli bacterium]
MIYFDNAATTALRPQILHDFVDLSTKYFANPNSVHQLGIESNKILNESRKRLISNLADSSFRLIFTSGATEGNNTFIKGAALNYRSRGMHLITSLGEHPSVLDAFFQLRDQFGFSLTIVPLQSNGEINYEYLAKSIRPDTILVSIMQVNNETGAVNDLKRISEIVRQNPRTLLHSDVTQSIGKISIPFALVDAFCFSAHKIHGLKGSGALLLRKEISLVPLFSGGGQEEGYRSGTQSLVPDILLAKTVRLALEQRPSDYIQVKAVFDYLYYELSLLDELNLNSNESFPYIINFSLKTAKASVVVEALSNYGIMVSTVAACSAKKHQASQVIASMFDDLKRAENTIRISICSDNTVDEAKIFMSVLVKILRGIKK